MRTSTSLEQGVSQTEELEINGASLVFYTTKILDKHLSKADLAAIERSSEFKKIQLNDGYIEKIFKVDKKFKEDYLIFSVKQETQLPIKTFLKHKNITPIVQHYITVYSKSILLIQSIIVFDCNNISKFTKNTYIENPIDVDLILNFIHKVRDVDDDWHINLYSDIEKFVSQFLNYNEKIVIEKNEQAISIQIWDIDSVKFKKDEIINGSELSSRYEIELATLLSCYNDHFVKDGLWRQQSANNVSRSSLSKTDVLNDHQILVSERVCIEISQIDHPELRNISASRLAQYGYDSTSIFLWGYVAILCAGYMFCDTATFTLQQSMSEKIKNIVNHNYTGKEILEFSHEKQKISKMLDSFSKLRDICIEERHKNFISAGYKIRGLNDITIRIKRIFNEIEELTNIFVGIETSELLKEMKALTTQNERNSKSLALISGVVAVLTLVHLKDALKLTTPYDTIWISGVIILALIYVLLNFVKLK